MTISPGCSRCAASCRYGYDGRRGVVWMPVRDPCPVGELRDEQRHALQLARSSTNGLFIVTLPLEQRLLEVGRLSHPARGRPWKVREIVVRFEIFVGFAVNRKNAPDGVGPVFRLGNGLGFVDLIQSIRERNHREFASPSKPNSGSCPLPDSRRCCRCELHCSPSYECLHFQHRYTREVSALRERGRLVGEATARRFQRVGPSLLP